jgi:hypothetical protein
LRGERARFDLILIRRVSCRCWHGEIRSIFQSKKHFLFELLSRAVPLIVRHHTRSQLRQQWHHWPALTGNLPAGMI